ncbi:MAG: ribonuclease P protein component [Prevotellaceae bacterium]|jgi:ribonuclease P protein component|nr:ribonuclease P protein component [Prevotellaceae bacterium]
MVQSCKHVFRKNERLRLRKDIEDVMQNGKKFLSYPFFVNYVIKNKDRQNSETTKIAISVAKRNFKKAVDRNLLKRRIREAYRQHKHNLNATARNSNKVINAIIVYVPKEKLSYEEIKKGIIRSMEKLAKNIENHNDISIHIAD